MESAGYDGRMVASLRNEATENTPGLPGASAPWSDGQGQASRASLRLFELYAGHTGASPNSGRTDYVLVENV